MIVHPNYIGEWYGSPHAWRDNEVLIPLEEARPGIQGVLNFYDVERWYIQRPKFDQNADLRRFHLANPRVLQFNPFRVCMRESWQDAKDENGVFFRDVWSDPVARTLWLCAKGSFLTDQYFRGRCLSAAAQLRKYPPCCVEELRARWNPVSAWTAVENIFYLESLPYVIAALQDAHAWPFFRLPLARLRYVVRVSQEERNVA